MPKTLEITMTVYLPDEDAEWFFKNDEEALATQADIVMEALKDYHNEVSYTVIGKDFWHDTRKRFIPKIIRKFFLAEAI